VVPQACPWGSIGIMDNDWFAFLAQQPGIDEVNFWQSIGPKPVYFAMIKEKLVC
jgi:hypothetical protein